MPREPNKQQELALLRLEKAMDKKLTAYYKQALADIQASIGAYEAKGILTQADMYKYGRLLQLEKSIDESMARLTGQTTNTIKAGLKSTAITAYHSTGFIIELQAQANLSFGKISDDVIKRAIANPFDRIGWLKRNAANNSQAAGQLKDALVQGLIRGRSYKDISKTVAQRLEISENRAKVIARTENHRVMNAARSEAMSHAENLGVKIQKRWVAALDDRTRSAHGELDGQQVDRDDLFEVRGYSADAPGQFGVPELDINCRCSMISVVVGYEPEFRRVRGEGIVPYKTYEEWAKARDL